jgi:ankyrin repeat protein
MQRVDEPSSNFVELPSEIILREIVSNLDPKFVCAIFPQINRQLSIIIDPLFWKNKIEKHFPDYFLKYPFNKVTFNKATFKKIEAEKYPQFSESEKELVRLIKERDIESLEKLPITLEMLDKKDQSGTSILSMAEKINYLPLLSCLYTIGFEVAKKSYANENGKLDHKKTDVHGRTILYWALIFKQNVEILLELMKQGSFAEFYFNEFQPFHLAVKLGRLDFIKALFEDDAFTDSLGSLLEQKDVKGQTPLILAAKNNDGAIVSFLLDLEADHNAVTGIFDQRVDQMAVLGLIDYGDYGKTAFHWLVQSGNLAMIKLFIEKFPQLLEEKDIFGEVPLIWAVRAGQTQVVKFILDKGARPDIRIHRPRHSLHGKTAFHSAVELGSLEMVKIFIERFPNLMEQKDIFGEVPLIWAASSGHMHIVKYFLDQGAHPNVRTDRPGHENDKKTPLHWAIAKGHKAVVEILIKSGAVDNHEYGEEKLRTMHLAAKQNQLEIIKILTETVPDLSYISDLNRSIYLSKSYIKDLPNLHHQKNAYDQTPLLFAAQKGHVEIVKFFLDRNASPNVRINRPNHKDHLRTALQLAFENKHVSTVAVLVQKGADATIPIQASKGFVHIAAAYEEFEMLKALIENDPNPPNLPNATQCSCHRR